MLWIKQGKRLAFILHMIAYIRPPFFLTEPCLNSNRLMNQ